MSLFIHALKNHKWATLDIPGNVSRSRLFGMWLASISGNYRAGNEDNPGREDESKQTQRSYAFGVGGSATIPGKLILDNLDDGRRVTIDAGVEDSEILLVEGAVVIFRVGDSIFRANIEEKKLGPRRLLLQDPRVEQIHWAIAATH